MGVGSRRVPELLAAHPELDLEEPDWYLRALHGEFESIQRRARQWLEDEHIAEQAIVVSPRPVRRHAARCPMPDLDYATTWLQELPQDAFNSAGGRIGSGIAC